jgi:tetratricopeptide (TPR) repeat protein
LTAALRRVKLARMIRPCWFVFATALALSVPARAGEVQPPGAAAEPQAKPPAAPEAKSPAEAAAELFDRLAHTQDPDEAAGIVTAIGRLWLASGSDTSDLLMSRALQAMQEKSYPLALEVLDAVVDLQPDWAEAWNKRATVRYLAGDSQGSMADIAETLKREPRHLGALAGLGAILEEAGRREEALQVYQRALDIAPHYGPMKDAVERLKAALAGQTL